MVWSDALSKGIPLLPYLGACLLVIVAAVSGVFLAVFVLDHLRSSATATAAFFFILASALALCIWLCLYLFTRLVKKYAKGSGNAK